MSQDVIRNTTRARPLDADDVAAISTLYGKADLTDVKAKSKVFKVTCVGGSWDTGGGGIG